MNKKEIIDLGAITINRKDPRTKQLLMKFFQEVLKGNYTYNPFNK
jgi:hypothetical protein